jgi:2-amino-4-hydroxy-6-hydroxymethyldihydropteridine diphosphokinase
MRAYVGIGGNLGNRRATLTVAVQKLCRLPQTRVLKTSSFQWSDPEGGEDQPRYLNGAAELESDLTPEELLEQLLKIETSLGRIRSIPKGPRTVDLDLLLFGKQAIQSRNLELPHPRITKRRFVLEPLSELCPDIIIPGTKGSVLHHLQSLNKRERR